MADWFKFYNNGLEEPRMQFAISEQPLVTSVWLAILSEASKARSSQITWRDLDFELFGYARKLNISTPILNQCIGLLERIGYIQRKDGKITIDGWDKLQSDYAKGLDKGYYKKTNKDLASKSLVSTVRGEERREEENVKENKREDHFPECNSYEPPLRKPSASTGVVKFKERLSALYRRNGDPWSYEEERLAVETCNRLNAHSELGELEVFRDTMSDPAFFPRSVLRLLQNWQPTLDNARAPKPIDAARKKELDHLTNSI